VSKRAKLLAAIRHNPNNVRFEDLLALLLALGFVEVRQAGSHKQFKHPQHPEVHVTLQNSKGKAKPYQVRQALEAIDTCKLEAK
jgi:predicted RNA binding protein YcfA (HicA-like mRNA interferase family)